VAEILHVVEAYYNHQTWEKGRNVVRYVARDQIADLKNAIAGYQLFLKLTQAYADEVIRRSRLARKAKT
jgi:ribosomal protein S17E